MFSNKDSIKRQEEVVEKQKKTKTKKNTKKRIKTKKEKRKKSEVPGIRTHDLSIRRLVLYQLSYCTILIKDDLKHLYEANPASKKWPQQPLHFIYCRSI